MKHLCIENDTSCIIMDVRNLNLRIDASLYTVFIILFKIS